MLTAPHSFRLLWKRAVAALSLLAAAALGPTAPAPVNGAGVNGSRVGSGAALANSANTLLANVAALVEGGQHKLPTDASRDTGAKAYAAPARHQIAVLRPEAASLAPEAGEPVRTYAARSGLTRAPPRGSPQLLA